MPAMARTYSKVKAWGFSKPMAKNVGKEGTSLGTFSTADGAKNLKHVVSKTNVNNAK